MCGWFAETFRRDFDRILYMFGTCIIVDYSLLLILLTRLCLRLHRPVLRGYLVYQSVLSASLPSPRTCEALLSCLHIFSTIASTSLRTRKDDRAYQVNTVGCQLHDKEGKRVYTPLQYPGIHYNWFWSFWLCFRDKENTVWAV